MCSTTFAGRRPRNLHNSGLTLGFGDNFSLDFRYWDTNISNKGNFCGGNTFQCDERYVATAKVTF